MGVIDEEEEEKIPEEKKEFLSIHFNKVEFYPGKDI